MMYVNEILRKEQGDGGTIQEFYIAIPLKRSFVVNSFEKFMNGIYVALRVTILYKTWIFYGQWH